MAQAIKKPKEYIHAVGRRREAVARVRLYTTEPKDVIWGEQKLGKGDMLVNMLPAGKYFGGKVAQTAFMEPFRVTNTIGKYGVTVKVEGGGKAGQLDALILGVARALDIVDSEKHHAILRKKGFLTRDSRIRERRKVGRGGKARRAKQSPKR